MTTIGTPFSKSQKKVLLCGSGELGKEVVIELKRLGCEVIAIDAYKNAPAMQVADRSHVLSMLDGEALRAIIELEKPHYIVPEVEAIATDTLIALETEGYNVVPSAKAAKLTMNREGIRSLAAETLSLPTSPYRFCDTFEAYKQACTEIGFPCVVKPIMSSSGKGQSTLKSSADLERTWAYAQEGGRAGAGRVIVEGFIDFDYEISLLTVRHRNGTSFCAPIGHRQEDGDYQESWQPQQMSEIALKKAQDMALKVTEALGGWGLFGAEFFVKGDDVFFSEISPRPHDTGMVTLISQPLSEFALHVRAFMGLPIPSIPLLTIGENCQAYASAAIVVRGHSKCVCFSGLDDAISHEHTNVRLFGKPEVNGKRRMGVVLAGGKSTKEAVSLALQVKAKISINLE